MYFIAVTVIMHSILIELRKLCNSHATCVYVTAVRFSLLPSQQVATQRCILNQVVGDLRHQFAVEMKMADELIQILFDGNVI